MSNESVEVVAASWAAYARGDYGASLELYAEDTVWDDTQYRPDGAVHVGHGALIDLVGTWLGTWEHHQVEVEDVLDAGGDRVAVVLWEKGEGKGGGVELTNRYGVVATVRNGKIVHTTVFRTPDQALEAAGLSETADR
jgi:ketosteroid isomerase-like protein